jgi:hypothetical protein
MNARRTGSVVSVSASRVPAVFDGPYRYRLYRDLGSGDGTFVWVGKNPSLADQKRNDSSVSRVMKRAKALGYRHFVVVNLYAYVSQNPSAMLDSWLDAEGPVGPKNVDYIDEAVREADYVLIAWGHDFVGPRHAQAMLDRIVTLGGRKVHCLGIGKKGSPKHPGRLAADTPATPWSA